MISSDIVQREALISFVWAYGKYAYLLCKKWKHSSIWVVVIIRINLDRQQEVLCKHKKS